MYNISTLKLFREGYLTISTKIYIVSENKRPKTSAVVPIISKIIVFLIIP